MIIKIDNPLEACQLKFASKDKGEFEGYASVFNGVDAVKDTILEGAFSESIKGRAPSMFVNHDSYQVPVGDWIGLSEDSTGLHVKGRIDLNHKDGPTVYSALLRKAMDAMSIGFRIPAGGAEEKEDGSRIIKKIDLKEISIVNFPADDSARISVVKSDLLTMTSLKDCESFLRDSGYSKSAATTFVSRIKEIIRCDTEIHFKDEITRLEAKRKIQGTTDSLSNLIQSLKL